MPIPGSNPDVGFEIEPFGGASRRFRTIGEVRSAILRGEIPRTVNIRTLGGPADGKSATVEDWARSNDKLRSLYTPVWSMTLKGALLGLIVVGSLQALDTFVSFWLVNRRAGVLWLLMCAFLVSPKWKPQIAGSALVTILS